MKYKMNTFNLIIIFSFLYKIISNQNDFLSESNDSMDELVKKLDLANNLNIILGYIYMQILQEIGSV